MCRKTENHHLQLAKKAFVVEAFGQDFGEGRDACPRSGELLWSLLLSPTDLTCCMGGDVCEHASSAALLHVFGFDYVC